MRFDLPAEGAEAALKRFSQQAGVEVLFPTGVVAGVRTTAVRGDMTAREAIDAMLAGTALVAVAGKNTESLTVRRKPPAKEAEPKPAKTAGSAQNSAKKKPVNRTQAKNP